MMHVVCRWPRGKSEVFNEVVSLARVQCRPWGRNTMIAGHLAVGERQFHGLHLQGLVTPFTVRVIENESYRRAV